MFIEQKTILMEESHYLSNFAGKDQLSSMWYVKGTFTIKG